MRLLLGSAGPRHSTIKDPKRVRIWVDTGWGSQAIRTGSPKVGKRWAQPYGDEGYMRPMSVMSVGTEVPITEPDT